MAPFRLVGGALRAHNDELCALRSMPADLEHSAQFQHAASPLLLICPDGRPDAAPELTIFRSYWLVLDRSSR
jgi:hypothetical protein